jgi:hypothetical protein
MFWLHSILANARSLIGYITFTSISLAATKKITKLKPKVVTIKAPPKPQTACWIIKYLERQYETCASWEENRHKIETTTLGRFSSTTSSQFTACILSYYHVTFPDDPVGRADSDVSQHAIRIIILHDLHTSFHSEETKWDYVVIHYGENKNFTSARNLTSAFQHVGIHTELSRFVS